MLFTQRLSPRLGIQVQIRCFPKTAHSITHPGLVVVVRGAMPVGPVVPDGQVVFVPSEPDLGVVVLCDKLRHQYLVMC